MPIQTEGLGNRPLVLVPILSEQDYPCRDNKMLFPGKVSDAAGDHRANNGLRIGGESLLAEKSITTVGLFFPVHYKFYHKIQLLPWRDPKSAIGFGRPSVGVFRGMFFVWDNVDFEFAALHYPLTVLPRPNGRYRRISGVVGQNP